MSKKDVRLVWSDDPKDRERVEGKSAAKVNVSPSAGLERNSGSNWIAVFRLEKSGRGGKTVTVIDQLPKQELFLKELCKELKNKCGTGGTYDTSGKEGLIEIQGDKREAIKAIFDKKGYKYKGM